MSFKIEALILFSLFLLLCFSSLPLILLHIYLLDGLPLCLLLEYNKFPESTDCVFTATFPGTW